MTTTAQKNGISKWWTPALAMTFAITLLGATQWMIADGVACVESRVMGRQAVTDERTRFIERELGEIKSDVKEIRRHLMGK